MSILKEEKEEASKRYFEQLIKNSKPAEGAPKLEAQQMSPIEAVCTHSSIHRASVANALGFRYSIGT